MVATNSPRFGHADARLRKSTARRFVVIADALRYNGDRRRHIKEMGRALKVRAR